MHEAASRHPEFLMFYNVENLFSADDPAKNPSMLSGLNRWTPARYSRKIEKLARVFEMVRLQRGRCPR